MDADRIYPDADILPFGLCKDAGHRESYQWSLFRLGLFWVHARMVSKYVRTNRYRVRKAEQGGNHA